MSARKVQNCPAEYANVAASAGGTAKTNDRVSGVSSTTAATGRAW
jgi:hypothetical protein